jgi:hypothetical protein
MAAAAGVGLMIGRCALETRIVGYGKPTYF